jgi:hypothetical protein
MGWVIVGTWSFGMTGNLGSGEKVGRLGEPEHGVLRGWSHLEASSELLPDLLYLVSSFQSVRHPSKLTVIA